MEVGGSGSELEEVDIVAMSGAASCGASCVKLCGPRTRRPDDDEPS